MSADYFLCYLGLAFLAAGRFVSLQSPCLHCHRLSPGPFFDFISFQAEHTLVCTCGSCEVAFSLLCSCRTPEDERKNVTVADVWTLEGEHLPNYMVRAGLLLQVEDMCVGCCNDELKGTSRAEIYRYRRSVDLRLNLQHDILMDMVACILFLVRARNTRTT